MEKPAGKEQVGGATLLVYTEEQQKRLGVDKSGKKNSKLWRCWKLQSLYDLQQRLKSGMWMDESNVYVQSRHCGRNASSFLGLQHMRR
jgi:hypothetical protein